MILPKHIPPRQSEGLALGRHTPPPPAPRALSPGGQQGLSTRAPQDWGKQTPLSEATYKVLSTPRPKQYLHKNLGKTYLGILDTLLGRQRSADLTLPTACRLQHWNASGQTTSKTGAQRHLLPEVILSSQPPQNTPLDTALPIRGTRPSSKREDTRRPVRKPAQAPVPTSSTRGQTLEARGTTILQPAEGGPQTERKTKRDDKEIRCR